MIELFSALSASAPVGWTDALVALLLSFGLAQVVALFYMATYRGLSYSRSFVQGMALGAVVTCMLMLAIGGSIAAGIGIAGGLAIVRFRTTMRDPRDMVFIFASLAVGIVCGLRAYPSALAGTGIFVLGAWVLDAVAYGSRRQADGLVRLVAPLAAEEGVSRALRAQCRSFVLVTLREVAQGEAMEHAWQVTLMDPGRKSALVAALQAVPGVQDVTLYIQEPTLEL